MTSLRALCVASFALLSGCAFHTEPPTARVHHGPAFGRVVDPIAAVPVTCISMGHVGRCLPEHQRAVATATRMALEFAGPGSVAWDPDDESGAELQRIVLNSFQSSIAGGTDEIQRNIIGDRVLGLPREPSVDRGVPFRELKVGTQTS